MAREYTRVITKKLVKAYLTLNRGRQVTSNEMASWINDPNNRFGLKSNISPKAIGRMIKDSQWDKSNILYDVEIIEGHPNKYVLK